ncbi:P-loop NTPase fold protein [Myxosarcina sp. GI1]|uniref:P-loop NTPase fold protein n=1 Tax=Myxosarcina sp. GI1 TaxID=1541065 RepID=UPI000907991F|nr:P-loop NTPase fold protein [Myxosarcina sp. GI1]
MTQEDLPISEINSHIEEYLDYYCGLSHAPGFAVLLKGEWGCGKTWFINKYREKFENKKQKFLYVSLYGMTSFTEIENSFFQQLHPLLSSKGMAITGKILQGVLRTTLKIDLNSDGKDDGSVSLQIPKIDIPESFKKADERILIFDDLERCQIDVGNLLGYINYFVEHQDFKVILVANEAKLISNNNYTEIKEKLIGKTFDINRDLDGALKDFIKELNNLEIEKFLFSNTELIEDIYYKAEYENLRTLKQIILDFERIFKVLPEKAKAKPELLKEILKLLMAFSIEIKRGNLLPKSISIFQQASVFKLTEAKRDYIEQRATNNQDSLSNSSEENNKKTIISLTEIIERYTFLDSFVYQPLPNLAWWQSFLDKGDTNPSVLNKSISNSKYFQDENTPNWIRLWRFYDLSDENFDTLLKKVESEYERREFTDIRDIKDVTGLFMKLSDIGLYSKSKEELFQNSKNYVEDLIGLNRLNLNLDSDCTLNLRKESKDFKEIIEYQKLCVFIKEVRQASFKKSLPNLGLKLLDIMVNEPYQFYSIICSKDSDNTNNNSHRVYSEIPIFQHIKVDDFFEKFLSLNFDAQRTCFYGIEMRYKFHDINKKLFNELQWLYKLRSLLVEHANFGRGKPSGYRFELLINVYLDRAIENLLASFEIWLTKHLLNKVSSLKIFYWTYMNEVFENKIALALQDEMTNNQ